MESISLPKSVCKKTLVSKWNPSVSQSQTVDFWKGGGAMLCAWWRRRDEVIQSGNIVGLLVGWFCLGGCNWWNQGDFQKIWGTWLRCEADGAAQISTKQRGRSSCWSLSQDLARPLVAEDAEVLIFASSISANAAYHLRSEATCRGAAVVYVLTQWLKTNSEFQTWLSSSTRATPSPCQEDPETPNPRRRRTVAQERGQWTDKNGTTRKDFLSGLDPGYIHSRFVFCLHGICRKETSCFPTARDAECGEMSVLPTLFPSRSYWYQDTPEKCLRRSGGEAGPLGVAWNLLGVLLHAVLVLWPWC